MMQFWNSFSQFSRSNIADQIHRIMETQWQKTIEVLTNSPSNQNNGECETVNLGDWRKAGRVENENFQTPKSSRNSRTNNQDDDNRKREVIEAYIELVRLRVVEFEKRSISKQSSFAASSKISERS
jgi:hypothetical protein